MMSKVMGKLRDKSSRKKKEAVSKKSKSGFSQISPDVVRSLVEKRAYSFYEKRGCTPGNDLKDWYEAEKSIIAGLKK